MPPVRLGLFKTFTAVFALCGLLFAQSATANDFSKEDLKKLGQVEDYLNDLKSFAARFEQSPANARPIVYWRT